MRAVSYSPLCVFLVLLLSPSLVCSLYLNHDWTNLFNDPYNGGGLNGRETLLNIDVQLCEGWIFYGNEEPIGGAVEPNNILDSISVQLPTSYLPGQATATLSGPSFGPRKITGSTDIPGGGSSRRSTALWVAWDEPTKTLTFTGFTTSFDGIKTVNDASAEGLNYVNVNFDIPDGQWVSPSDPNAANPNSNLIPLDLVLLPGVPAGTTSKVIVLNDKSHFTAVANRDKCGGNNIVQDPIFSGFQGQVFQFHGLPDEHFNLVSAPDVQLNSHFVYLSSGKCDYNDTECFTHPGTYMDVLGFSIADTHVRVVAGPHEQGLRVWLNDHELQRGAHVRSLSNNVTASFTYHHDGRVDIRTEIMSFQIVNSDMFVNLQVGLNNPELLRVGRAKHTVTDHAICKNNFETHNYQLIEQTVNNKYPVNTPLHGLIGQTWRNVKVCGRDWMGTVQDYLVSDLFATDNHFNYFKW